MNSSSTAALEYLWRHSILGTHPQSADAFDPTTGRLDIARLEPGAFGWSSGELILVGIAIAIAIDRRGPRIDQLWALDPVQRAAASQALVIWWRR